MIQKECLFLIIFCIIFINYFIENIYYFLLINFLYYLFLLINFLYYLFLLINFLYFLIITSCIPNHQNISNKDIIL